MASSSTSTTRSGGSTSSLLGVAFVILKLTHVIGWSWWWVLLPFYGGLILLLGILALIGVVMGLLKVVSSIFESRSRKKRIRHRYGR